MKFEFPFIDLESESNQSHVLCDLIMLIYMHVNILA